MSVASIGRDATSKLTFDVTAVADSVQGSGRLCEQSGYTYFCDFTLRAQLVSGSTVSLQTFTIPWDSSTPFTHEFTGTGTVDVTKIVAVEVYVHGYGGSAYTGWTPVTDPLDTPAVSLSVGSIGRDATSKLTFDVTAVADDVQGSGRLCEQSGYTYFCDFTLVAQLVSGSSVLLQKVTIPWGSNTPFTNEFNGTIDVTKIVAVEVYVHGYGGSVYTGWTPVTDPLDTPAVSLSVGSIGRDATSKLTFDVTAVADGVQGSGRLCEQSGYTYFCDFTLLGQLVSGSTVVLQKVTIPWSSNTPFTNEFTGTIDTKKIVAVQVHVYGYGGSVYTGWTPVTDPATMPSADGSVSIAVTSVARDASTGNLMYDVSASMSGATASDSPCFGGSCSLSVQSMSSTGAIATLGSVSVPVQASFTKEFSGSVASAKVTAVRAYTSPANNHPASYSGWVPVTDPYSDRSVTLGAISIDRDASTGKLVYDISASVAGRTLPDGPCYGTSTCVLHLQTKTAAGDVSDLGSVTMPVQASYTKDFSGLTPSAKVTAVRAYAISANPAVYSGWVTVTDPYPDRSVTLNAISIDRDASTGRLAYDISASVAGRSLPDGPCFGTSTCVLHLQTKTAAGDVSDLGSVTMPVQASYSKDFSGSVALAKITAVRAYTVSSSPAVYSGWYSVHDGDKTESAGGGNKSAKGCTCSNGDPVNTQSGEFYETQTDLGLPGVGPIVEAGRTYSSLNAAVNGPFGYGWSGDFGSHLVIDTDGDSTDPLPRQLRIVQENGATTPFTENSSGLYPADPWVLATLTHDASSGQWTFTRDKKQVFVFDSSGTLISTSDLHGNTVTYGYSSGHVTSITGSGGREIDLIWTSGRVSAIADSAGRAVAFGYDSAGNLTVVDAADDGLWGYSYDSSHRVLTETKPDGGVTTNVYNSTGQVTSQTDPMGRVTTFAYSGLTTIVTLPDGSITTYTFNQGQPATITTASGTALASTTTYTYDESGNRVSETDGLGHTTSYTYDSAGNALTTTDALGKVTTRTYDSLRDVTSVEDPLGRTTSMTYNSVGDLTSLETPGGHTSTWTLNSDGTIDTSIDARGKTTSYTYDSAGRPLCVTDPDNRETCQADDGRGLATNKTDAAGKVTQATYDDAGRVLTVEDPNSHTTTYVYDGDGNLTSTEDASGNTVTATYDHADQRLTSADGRGKSTAYTYTARGSVATVTDPNLHVTTNAYDAQNRLVSVTDADGHLTAFAYDLAGRKTSTTLPSTAVSSSTYDADGRVATTTDALGKVTIYAYDDAGQLQSVTDPLSRVTAYSYTDDSKLHITTLPDSSTETYTYNADDVQTSFENTDGQTTAYSYDDAGLLSSETQPGSMTTSYTYDSAGRIHTVTTPDGVLATRSYDDGGRLTEINYPGAADDVSYTYFADGTRHTMTDGTGTTTYAYNANAALTSVQNGDGQTIGYGYDDASQLTSITYPGAKTVTYGYDDAGNMISVTDWASRTTNLTVNSDGLQQTRTDPSGVTETRSYDANDQLTDINTATTSATLADYGYGYDDAGQLTSSTTTDALHPSTATDSWGYTPLGQLSSTGASTGYTTTPAGELRATPAGDAFTYNGAQELVSASNSSFGTNTAFAYDDNGSRTSATTTFSSAPTVTVGYSYDARGNLSSATTDTTEVEYTSDGDGLRQTRAVGGITQQFLWDPNHATPLLLDDGAHSYIYSRGTIPSAQIDDTTGAIEYLHGDNVGSVRTMTDGSGNTVGTTDFSPYGAVKSYAGTSGSNFGYASAWTDPITGTDYLRAREYDPGTAQFLQVDPAVDSTRQPYAYVMGDPLSAADPTGLFAGICDTGGDSCWNYFWGGLLDHIGAEAKVAMAGFDNGALGGIPDQLGWTCSSLKSDDLYWAEYAIGGVVTAAATFGTGEAITQTLKAASGLADAFRLSTSTSAAGTAALTASSNANTVRQALSGLADGTKNVKTVASESQLRDLFQTISAGGTDVTPSTYNGVMTQLEDGTRIGLRETSSSGGPTIDVKYPTTARPWKVHIGQ